MKAFRLVFGLLMISALLALMFHQHDVGEHHDGAGDADSREQCPAKAWHAGAVQATTVVAETPAAPVVTIAAIRPAAFPVSETRPQAFLPRGPPSATSI
ncbi:MAG: hypothetical protein N2689_07950 [Verrucomicrobiae bacterium]|nr:hypothetical protein [Verrucomicrobiae bacterium]